MLIHEMPHPPFEAHNALQQPPHGQQDELDAQIGTPAHNSEDQASFEQQLNDLDLDDLNSISPPSVSVSLAPNSATATSSSVPGEAASGSSRYPASSFVSARAQLAATLTGATLEALRSEIDLAEQQAARWSPATASAVDRDSVFNDVVRSSYVTLRRFQNRDSDCKPHAEENTRAIVHVRNTARDHSSVGDHPERYPIDRARQAGWHMRGKTTTSPFVSLVEDPAKLVASRDHLARAIANNADALHTYTLPKLTVWTPDDVLSSIALRMNAEDHDNIDADVDLMCSLGRTPTRETERLFLGGNLESYRTGSGNNPYKRDSNE
ncbi:hypothetical protein [Bradyrhizobium sacchari]|uniref:Uncharacterized protein n=1 Tax=Bradyrhizobium sacchari TaxID=1399419 RepID=A0A560JEB5_9BRAD|nr:hypothetical protein [Bradyrhizobium sacchari]TWB51258.1 hypothetical protein FBZ94_11088 [Bradyrhizobium sacchari]TWB69492.1 hypothetical protein FBZ95_10988 [Bradyrhizobium sacchari]